MPWCFCYSIISFWIYICRTRIMFLWIYQMGIYSTSTDINFYAIMHFHKYLCIVDKICCIFFDKYIQLTHVSSIRHWDIKLESTEIEIFLIAIWGSKYLISKRFSLLMNDASDMNNIFSQGFIGYLIHKLLLLNILILPVKQITICKPITAW